MKHSSVHSIYILTMIHSTTSLSGIRLITSLFMFVMCSHWHNPLLQLPFASISFVGANLLQQILSLFSFICIYFFCSFHFLQQFLSNFATFCNNYFRYFPSFATISYVYYPPFATISFIFVHLSNNFLRYFLLCMV